MSKFSIARSTPATLGAASLAAISTPAAAREADQKHPSRRRRKRRGKLSSRASSRIRARKVRPSWISRCSTRPSARRATNENFLDAIATTSVSDTYRYMTGIQRAGNTSYDITFRGFKTSGNDRNAILTDGMPEPLRTLRFAADRRH